MSIQLLISVYPEAIDVEDNDGFLPSHYLTDYLKRNVKKRHKNNRFLLHMARTNNYSKHLVTLLVRDFPQMCLKRDNHGKISLHYACKKSETPTFTFYVLTLLGVSLDSLYIEDRQGRTPRKVSLCCR